ncbi:MAG: beta strand repeat-containing protein, partial [Planctomycetota bacterium]
LTTSPVVSGGDISINAGGLSTIIARTNAIERLRINSVGAVGINTAGDINAQFQVNGAFPDVTTAIIRGAPSQTADLAAIQGWDESTAAFENQFTVGANGTVTVRSLGGSTKANAAFVNAVDRLVIANASGELDQVDAVKLITANTWGLKGNDVITQPGTLGSAPDANGNFLGTKVARDLGFVTDNVIRALIDTGGTFRTAGNLVANGVTVGRGRESTRPGNTAVGTNTLVLNNGGDNNTAFGTAALRYNTLGNRNTAVGVSALQGPTGGFAGSDNVAIGYLAGSSAATNTNNRLYIANSATNNLIFGDFANGRLLVNAGATPPADLDAALQVNSRNAGDVGFIVRGAGSQNANLFEAQNSSGTILARINNAGNTTLSGTLTVNGATALSNTLTVQGTATLNGATTVDNTLTVTGLTTINDNLDLNGNGDVSGTLTIGGVTTIGGATQINNTLTTTGAATIGNGLTVANASATSLTGTLGVSGATTLNNGLTVTAGGATVNGGGLTVANAGATSLTGTLGVTGATTLNNGLTVANASATSLTGALGVTGATTLNNGLTVTAGGATVNGGGLTVANAGATSLTGTLTVDGVALVNNTLRATGGIINTAIGAGGTASTGQFTTLGATSLSTSAGATIGNGLTVNAGGLTVTAGGATVTNGGLTVANAGATSLTGALTVGGATTITTVGGTLNGTFGSNDRLVVANGTGVLSNISPAGFVAASAWGLLGNAPASTGNGNNLTAAPTGNYLGTSNAQNLQLVTGGAVRAVIASTGEFRIQNIDVRGGAINGTAIGAGGASTGAFTSLSANAGASVGGGLTVTTGGLTVTAGGATVNGGGLTVANAGATSLTGTLGVT